MSRIKYICVYIYIFIGILSYNGGTMEEGSWPATNRCYQPRVLVHACRRDIAWVIALIPRTRTDIRKYLCREKKKKRKKEEEERKKKKKKVETKKPHPPRCTRIHDIESCRRNPFSVVSFLWLLRNLGFPFLPSLRFLFFPDFGRKEIRGYVLSFSSKRDSSRNFRLGGQRRNLAFLSFRRR